MCTVRWRNAVTALWSDGYLERRNVEWRFSRPWPGEMQITWKMGFVPSKRCIYIYRRCTKNPGHGRLLSRIVGHRFVEWGVPKKMSPRPSGPVDFAAAGSTYK